MTTDLLPDRVRAAFAPELTYLSTASYGLLPTAVVDAVTRSEQERASGRFDIVAVDTDIAACREAFGNMTGFRADQVAIGAQVSQFVGLVAAALPADARVVAVEDEFTSVLWPFLARAAEGVQVRLVPAAELVEAIDSHDDLVAVSPVQSADGAVIDPAAVVAAARSNGARVLFDLSQAAGWLPVQATGADWVVSVGYKWLLGPKGSAFLAATDDAAALVHPQAAGWYSGDDPWDTCYGGPLRLAQDARRFDVAPVWPAWVGQRISLELLASVGIDAVHRHDVALANRLRVGLGLEPGDSAIVSLAVPEGTAERLAAAGVVAAVRNGRLRLACHLYNTTADVDRALDVLAD